MDLYVAYRFSARASYDAEQTVATMIERKRTARKSRGTNSQGFTDSLSHVAEQGGNSRRHKYFRDMRTFLIPMVCATFFQILVYSLFFFRSSRSDSNDFIVTSLMIALAILISVTILNAFRHHETPIISAIAVNTIVFSFAVTFLSAGRVQVSYLGLAVSFPIALAILAAANIKFHRFLGRKVAVLDFPSAMRVQALFPGAVIIKDPEATLDDIDYVLVDPEEHHTRHWSPLLTKCYLGNVEILPWTRFSEIQHRRVDVDSFDIAHVVYTPGQFAYARLKRFIDIVAVILMLPICIPVCALVALYIFARDGGPVLFVQSRRGFAGRTFRMYKFRTMYNGREGGATGSDDNRIIPGCKFIRRARLDELPQLYNILIGEMSLIGPRPESIELAHWYETAIPEYVHRLLVLPGVTGWAQVNSGYTSNPDEAKVKLSYDLYYIKKISLDLELITLFKTIKTVLFGSGAR